MKLQFERYQLPLVASFSNSRSSWSQREGLALFLASNDSALGNSRHEGRGDVAPLPGYSRETLVECEQCLSSLSATALTPVLAANTVHQLQEALNALAANMPAAARFGLETAALDRLGKLKSLPCWSLLQELIGIKHKQMPPPVALAAVLPNLSCEELIPRAEALVEQGVTVFKLKVGPEIVTERQLRTLCALRERFGSQIRLRLDANQGLLAEGKKRLFRQLKPLNIDLWEEPWLWNSPPWPQFADCPLAVDESLQGLSLEESRERILSGCCGAVVLKPTALGGAMTCLSLAQVARQRGKRVIVSHTLESHIGWQACATLALALAGDEAAGLWPLDHQIPVPPSPIVEGRLHASMSPGFGFAPRELNAGSHG